MRIAKVFSSHQSLFFCPSGVILSRLKKHLRRHKKALNSKNNGYHTINRLRLLGCGYPKDVVSRFIIFSIWMKLNKVGILQILSLMNLFFFGGGYGYSKHSTKPKQKQSKTISSGGRVWRTIGLFSLHRATKTNKNKKHKKHQKQKNTQK